MNMMLMTRPMVRKMMVHNMSLTSRHVAFQTSSHGTLLSINWYASSLSFLIYSECGYLLELSQLRHNTFS